MKIFIQYLLFAFATTGSFAQSDSFTPDISRALFHSRLDDVQTYMLRADGKADRELTPYADSEINLHLTYQATTRIDQWQKQVEEDPAIDHNTKLRLLRGITELLKQFTDGVLKTGPTKPASAMHWHQLPLVLEAFLDAVELDKNGAPITGALQALNYDAAYMVAGSFAFGNNREVLQTKQFLLIKYLEQHPDAILSMLGQGNNYTYPFADSLIAVAARRNPASLVSFAQAAGTPVGQKIRANNDSFVKMLVEMAKDKQGQLYLPFLDLLTRNAITRQEIASAVQDSSKYYSLLVKTQVEYAKLAAAGENLLSAKVIGDMLKQKSMEIYVNTINGLHDFAAPIRFKKIQGLSPEELYYLIVMNEVEIYTSSYMYVYNRIFETMPVQSADSVLARVHYDRYKKFLTMSSNYNTLDNFLSRMSVESSTSLMTNFVNNLDKGTGEDDIEDAVDVANAYASITDTTIRKLMRTQVNKNLAKAVAENNRKGMIIYRLENLIMASSDGDSSINLSDSLGILPVYNVKNDYLRDDKGRIIMQMYFYGDEGGKGSFNALMRLMGDRNQWKMNSTAEWVQFTSTSSAIPFVLFANRALDEEKDLDEKAQENLITWMSENGYHPSITVHRGHSYYLKYTIEKMLPSSKVVVLGSCGAYHNLADILKISPEAYIIASKQVGYGVINIQLFMYLINELKRGKDVAWPTMMEDVGRSVAGRSGYEDYIFPHKNLGAIFIKAYKKALAEGI